MVNSMVERATSDMLIGPDWAMNIEICDMCNHDPAQSKDVVKGIKKRLGSKNPKVQLLALTLLETIVKNCGDIVHMHVAEKDLLHEMVKIVKKKPDFHVKEKILILVDTWQEAFGGPRARYPQFFAAYQELLRLGAVFPQRSDKSAPVFTPPQTNPLSSYPQNLRNPETHQDAAESSAEAEFPTLSLSEIQNARGIMDVLAEMLNALDPNNKEGLRQEVIVDLVEQCRNYKQRVVHLVNSTSDESLLCQGLALNDDLQRVLAKHESIASVTPILTEKPKSKPVSTLVDVDSLLVDTGDNKQPNGGSTPTTSAGTQLSVPTPPMANGTSTTQTKVDANFDLLSGEDFSSPKTEDSLALVPVGEHQPPSPVSHQNNALALVDMFSQNNSQPSNVVGQQSYPSTSQFQQQQQPPNFQLSQSPFYSNGGMPLAAVPQFEQPLYAQGTNTAWNGQMAQPQQPASPVYAAQTSSSLPPPPWEAQQADSVQLTGTQYSQPMQVTQVVVTHSQPVHAGAQMPGPQANDQVLGMYIQPITGGHLSATNNPAIYGNQFVGFQPQQIQGGQPMGVVPQPMQTAQMPYVYSQQIYNNQMPGYGYGYGYGQQQTAQPIEHSISALSVRDDGVLTRSSYSGSTPSYVHVPSGKPSKPEDRLFGDLVDIAKLKPKTTPGRAGSM